MLLNFGIFLNYPFRIILGDLEMFDACTRTVYQVLNISTLFLFFTCFSDYLVMKKQKMCPQGFLKPKNNSVMPMNEIGQVPAPVEAAENQETLGDHIRCVNNCLTIIIYNFLVSLRDLLLFSSRQSPPSSSSPSSVILIMKMKCSREPTSGVSL